MTSELWLAWINAEVKGSIVAPTFCQRMTDSRTGGARAGTYRYLCEFDQLS